MSDEISASLASRENNFETSKASKTQATEIQFQQNFNNSDEKNHQPNEPRTKIKRGANKVYYPYETYNTNAQAEEAIKNEKME
jgi:hypothetical protein